jgi:hypothetical protein
MNCESWLRAKKSRMTVVSAFGLISFWGVIESTLWSYMVMRSLDQALRAGQAHAALVGEQLAHGADAAAAEVVDVVDDALALAQAHEVLGGGDDVGALEDALLELGLEAELLVDLVAADAAEVVALRVEEEPLEERLGVGGRRRLARAQRL